MSNKVALIISGIILMTFFLAGLIDIIYKLDILGNLVSKILLMGSFVVFVVYVFKVNFGAHKKNLPK